jgi:hypothetical protein
MEIRGRPAHCLGFEANFDRWKPHGARLNRSFHRQMAVFKELVREM